MRPPTLVAIPVAALLVAATGCGREPSPANENRNPPPVELSFLADFHLAPGAEIESSEIGGISAVSYLPETGRWLALSDARVVSRFYELEVDYDGTKLRVEPRGVTPLRDREGRTFTEDALDPEGMARMPWGNFLVSTEPNTRRQPVEQAKLLEVEPSGALVRYIEIPGKFIVTGSPPDHGLRHNLGFEALGLSPDETELLVGTEGSLLQDGPAADFSHAGLCRILVYRVGNKDLSPEAEYVYPIGPFAREPGFVGEQEVSGGLVELVVLSNERALSLERVFVRELSGYQRDVIHARVYEIGLSEASDVRGVSSLLEHRDFRPVTKKLVLDFDDILPALSRDYPKLDNLEAMGLGPALPDGGRALLLASDDNFRKTQRTQFLLFHLKGT